MANEFVARNGLIAQNNSTVTGSLIVTGGITGSLLGTASYSTQALSSSFSSTASFVQNAQTASYVLNAVSSSFSSTASYANQALSSSFALTASYALSTNTIQGLNTTSSFSNLSTWNFNHGLNNRTVIIQVYDNNYNQIIPEEINLVDNNNVTIIFPTNESGFAIASLGGTTTTATTASFALTASYALNGGGGGIQVNDLFSYQFLLMGA